MLETHLGACRQVSRPGDVVWIPGGEGHHDTRFVDTPERGVLVVGEDNPQSSAPEHALYDWPEGCAGHRLRSLIFGIESARHLALWRTNLCCPAWSARAARDRAELLCGANSASPEDEPLPWTTIVLLGSKVAGAYRKILKCDFAPFTSWLWLLGGIAFVSLPHPSGRCQAWNNRANFGLAREVLHDVAPGIPWGEAS